MRWIGGVLLVWAACAVAAASPKVRLERTPKGLFLIVGSARPILVANSSPTAVLSDGTRIVIAHASGASELVMLYPGGRATSLPLSSNRDPLLTVLVAVEYKRVVEYATQANCTNIFSVGTHALATLSWINPAPSGSPTVFQHLVKIDSDGMTTPIRALSLPHNVPYEESETRLLKSGSALFLYDRDVVSRIDSMGRPGKVVAALPAYATCRGAANGRWAYFEVRKPNQRTVLRRLIVDLSTGKLIERTKSVPANMNFTRLSSQSMWIVFEGPSGNAGYNYLALSAADGQSVRLPFPPSHLIGNLAVQDNTTDAVALELPTAKVVARWTGK